MEVRTVATVEYLCRLKDEDVEMVQKYAEQENCSLREAVRDLYADGVIDLYYDSWDTDFSTEDIIEVEE